MHPKKMVFQFVRASLTVVGVCLVLSVMTATAFAGFGQNNDVPEIDAGSMAAALALVGFGASMLADRVRNRKFRASK